MQLNRPRIPAKTERHIFVEAGHRCACCGSAFPLERAHIVPWRNSKDHSEANLWSAFVQIATNLLTASGTARPFTSTSVDRGSTDRTGLTQDIQRSNLGVVLGQLQHRRTLSARL